jgi:alkanesulfonate monooxygenase SsuD/methylene tetrahydromethanopterin reductase-like flavin-dependent oxidoreductase (luciferase family)
MTVPLPPLGKEMPGERALAAFLEMKPLAQLVWVSKMSPDDLATLADALLGYAEKHDREPVSIRVFATILWTCDPREYNDREQESNLREALSAESLRKLREDTYENQVRPALHAGAVRQNKYVLSLIPDDRATLLKLLDRYAREFGRSERVRSLEELIRTI